MKLDKVLESFFQDKKEEKILKFFELNLLKNLILDTDTFRNVTNLHIIDSPTVVINNKPMDVESYLYGDSSIFTGDFYLYCIWQTPELFTYPITTAGPFASPIIFNSENYLPIINFTVTATISLEEWEEKSENLNLSPYKKKLLEELEFLIDNYPSTKKEGKRNLIIRGISIV